MAVEGDDLLAACTLRERLASGALRASELVDVLLARINELEPDIHAFAWHDPEFVRAQARALDEHRRAGRPIGPLHGLPVGIKDIIDTARIPTENGCRLDEGRVPESDAWIVSRLKSAGAIVMGKTVTTELAFMHPSPTRNPRNAAHTPGGSSAGSAAAVAAGMVPLAIGTQTAGSIVRPAAFCGVTGYKPTFGAIARSGVLHQAPSLDTIGVFAANPADAALVAEQLFGDDADDPATTAWPRPKLLNVAQSAPPLKPTFAFVRPPRWRDADTQTHQAFDALADMLGDQCVHVDLPPVFEQADDFRRRIQFAELAHCFARYRGGTDKLSDEVCAALEEGDGVTAPAYLEALDCRDLLYASLQHILNRADAILTPAALGPAPATLETTGDPIFNGQWTYLGMPAVTLPLLESTEGLPMGVQLIGGRNDDARLLRTANWLYTHSS